MQRTSSVNREIRESSKRILTVVGHFGSGKTEFAVSLAMRMAMQERPADMPRLALVDIDIANPYFRSRERKQMLEAAGISVYGNAYDGEITAELPALSAAIRTPLEDAGCRVIVDVGGNDSGARILHQFRKYFQQNEHELYAVINANRPETSDIDGALAHLQAIEMETGLTVSGLINNCHLLRETTPETVAQGHRLCEALCRRTGKPLICDCYPAPLFDDAALQALPAGSTGPYHMPLGLYMRESWLDKLI